MVNREARKLSDKNKERCNDRGTADSAGSMPIESK